MIIISFNINGIRAHIHQLEKIINKYNPFIIALQETKISNKIFPINFFKKYNYNNLYFNGYKNHYGVAIISKLKANNISYNFFETNNYFKYRIIICEFILNNKILLVINIYTPQGDNINNTIKFNEKKIFINELILFIKKIINKNLYILILGDLNISPYNLDIGISKFDKYKYLKFKRCSFLPEEILMYEEIINLGLIDIFRKMNPEYTKFTWFNYKYYSFLKNEGLRLDIFFANKKLFNFCKFTDMDYEIRSMHKPSDHVPIWLNICL